MFHILGFLFIIVIAVIIIGLALVGSVLRAVFGLGKRSPSSDIIILGMCILLKGITLRLWNILRRF